MLRNEVERLINAFLVELEEHDELSMGDDLIKSFQQAFTGKEVKEAPHFAITDKFVERKAYLTMENDFIEWSKKRLENWYNIKFNALQAVLNDHEIKKENAKDMVTAAIIVTRQGVKDHSHLRNDIYFLQDLAKQGYSLNYNLPWEVFSQENNKQFTKSQKIFVEKILNKAFQQALPDRRQNKR